MSAMKPKAILYDATFEKQWDKYLKKLTVKEKEQLKDRLSIFKEDAFDKRLKTHHPSKPTTLFQSPIRTE